MANHVLLPPRLDMNCPYPPCPHTAYHTRSNMCNALSDGAKRALGDPWPLGDKVINGSNHIKDQRSFEGLVSVTCSLEDLRTLLLLPLAQLKIQLPLSPCPLPPHHCLTDLGSRTRVHH